MAGSSMTFVYTEAFGKMRKVTIDWTSDDSDGTVSDTTKEIRGMLVKGVTNPGSPAPTANYDIAITDEESFDVLTNCTDNLVDRHTSNTEEVYFMTSDPISPYVCDKLTISVTNAGNSKQGRLILYYVTGEA